MCLLNQQKVPLLHDAVGYKVVQKMKSGRYRSPFARTPVSKKKWMVAKPTGWGFSILPHTDRKITPVLDEYGFHAYLDLVTARKALAHHQGRRLRRGARMTAVILLVELSDVFQTGNDASFESMEQEVSVVARAMRVIQEVQ